MSHSTDVTTLGRWMAADFSNQAQAIENPPLFAHIRVCMRPLPYGLLEGVSLYLEQAYDIALNQPYRVRVLRLITVDEHIEIENYRIAEEERFYGASRNPEQLQQLAANQVERMPGCNFMVEWTGQGFRGQVEPGKACQVIRKGKCSYLDSHFEIDAQTFISWDRGRDPETDEHLWGALAGPFEFTRRTNYSHEISTR
ncbi:MAG: chromophore lyase CpcT/CpeT [Cyanobacteria bacterium]|nr:chromophore lyase CpcT/CpeT [Cyanobacteriota bacterium]